MTTMDFFLTHSTDNLTLGLTSWFLSWYLSHNLLLIRETEEAFYKRVEMMSHGKTSTPDAPNPAIHFVRLHQRAMLGEFNRRRSGENTGTSAAIVLEMTQIIQW